MNPAGGIIRLELLPPFWTVPLPIGKGHWVATGLWGASEFLARRRSLLAKLDARLILAKGWLGLEAGIFSDESRSGRIVPMHADASMHSHANRIPAKVHRLPAMRAGRPVRIAGVRLQLWKSLRLLLIVLRAVGTNSCGGRCVGHGKCDRWPSTSITNLVPTHVALHLRGRGGDSSLWGHTEENGRNEFVSGVTTARIDGFEGVTEARFSFRELALQRKREAATRGHRQAGQIGDEEHRRKRERVSDGADAASLDLSTGGLEGDWTSVGRAGMEDASREERESWLTQTHSRAHTNLDSTYNTMESLIDRHRSSTVSELVARAQIVFRRAPVCQEALALYRIACEKCLSSPPPCDMPGAPSNASLASEAAGRDTHARTSSTPQHIALLAFLGKAEILLDLPAPYGVKLSESSAVRRQHLLEARDSLSAALALNPSSLDAQALLARVNDCLASSPSCNTSGGQGGGSSLKVWQACLNKYAYHVVSLHKIGQQRVRMSEAGGRDWQEGVRCLEEAAKSRHFASMLALAEGRDCGFVGLCN